MPEQNHQLAIKALCAKVDSNFFQVLTHSAQAASFLLADLYCFRAKATQAEKNQLCATLIKLRKQLTPSHIRLIWQTLPRVDSVEWYCLSRGAKFALTLLRKVLLRKKVYLQFIDTATLLELGKNPDWYREIFIALIRKHLWQHALNDPFKYPNFSYHLVSKGGVEQNFLYVSNFVAKCASLPVAELILLGRYQPKVAALILKDLINSTGYFQIGAAFARMHPCLRTQIAKDWQHILEVFPLNKEDDTYLQQALPLLKKDYPEFCNVAFDNRVTRHYQEAPQKFETAPVRTQSRTMTVIMLPAPVALVWYVFRRLNEQKQRESKTTQQSEKPAWHRFIGW